MLTALLCFVILIKNLEEDSVNNDLAKIWGLQSANKLNYILRKQNYMVFHNCQSLLREI